MMLDGWQTENFKKAQNCTQNAQYVQQGWQCPLCGRVYSPWTSMCHYCGGDSKTFTVTTVPEKGTTLNGKNVENLNLNYCTGEN